MEYTYDAWGYIRNTTGSLKDTLGKSNALRYRGYVYDRETGLYYLQSRYYNPGTGRFINADILIATGQGLLGNNMFAHCLNNPVSYADSTGNAAMVCFNNDTIDPALSWKVHGGGTSWRYDATQNEMSFFEKLLIHMARQRKDSHTFSVGYAIGSLWGGSGGGTSGFVSVDNSHNYALQRTDSLNGGFGVGTSVGLVFTYTNADNVQELKGSSSTYGATFCADYGISLDYISFTSPTNPGKQYWGFSVGILLGAEAEVHAGEAYTTSTASWNPFKALRKWLFG